MLEGEAEQLAPGLAGVPAATAGGPPLLLRPRRPQARPPAPQHKVQVVRRADGVVHVRVRRYQQFLTKEKDEIIRRVNKAIFCSWFLVTAIIVYQFL